MSESASINATVIQCPACDWQAQLGDFDHIQLGSAVQVHCPSCDANLGTPEQAFKRAV